MRGAFLSMVGPATAAWTGLVAAEYMAGGGMSPDSGRRIASDLGFGVVALALVLPILLIHMIRLTLRVAKHPSAGEQTLTHSPGLLSRMSSTVTLSAIGEAIGFVALIVPGVVLAIRWAFAPQVAVCEGLGGRAALRRSSGLTQGHVSSIAIVLGVTTFVPVLASLVFLVFLPPILVTFISAVLYGLTLPVMVASLTLTFLSHDGHGRTDEAPIGGVDGAAASDSQDGLGHA